MKYPSFEVRKARAVFTAKLQSILTRLDACATAEISSVLMGDRKTSTVTVTDVWVAGSYARGAAHCGDLDLIVRTTGGYATSAGVNHRLLGKLPDVRVYLGTPDDNGSGIPLPESVRIWGSCLDWEAAIAAIIEDPKAARFPRKTDALPMRTEQMCIGVDIAEELVEAHARGVYTWSFIPLDAITPVAVTDKDFLHELSWRDANSAQLRMVPYVHAFLNGLSAQAGFEDKFDDGFWMRDDTWVLMGNGLPNVALLNRPGISRIAVMPALNIRGPNGIFMIERGPAHPLVEVFTQDVAAWLIGEAGGPCKVSMSCNGEHDSACSVDAFATEEAARAYIADMCGDDDAEDCGPHLEPMYFAGRDLLEALRGVDLVDYRCVNKVLAFSREAAHVGRLLEAEYPGTRDIPRWLADFFSKTPATPPASAARLSNDYLRATEVDGGLFAVQLSDGGWSIADGPGTVLSEPDEQELAGWHLPLRFESEAAAAAAIRSGPDDMFDIAADSAWGRHCLGACAVACTMYERG